MRTALLEAEAASIGPALPSAPARLRVRRTFGSTLLLEIEDCPFLAALAPPAAAGLPHAVALSEAADFGAWPVRAGNAGRLEEGFLELEGEGYRARVSLRKARRRPRRAMPRVAEPGPALAACLEELARIQEGKGCALRIGAVAAAGGSRDALGEALGRAAGALASAAAARDIEGARVAVAGLVGLGEGLTPSGDDFLCGMLAAASGAAPLFDALADAVVDCLGRTNEVSASLLALAAAGYYPERLVDLGEALRDGDATRALGRLRAVCGLGHSSGSDLAAGYLAGVAGIATSMR